jgi:sulfur-carrier protein adenylyltransferase/sulfurtransferase
MQTGGNHIPEISPKELKARLDRNDPITLLDVREPHEAAIADLPEVGQHRIPLRELPDRLGELDPAAELIIYCRSGARSGGATLQLLERGFARVFNLEGGMLKWREDVDPSVRAY